MAATMSKTRFPWKRMLAGGALLAALAVLAVVLLGGDSGGGKATNEAGVPAFALNYPDGWQRVEPAAGEALAIQSEDGGGRVSMRIRGPVEQSLDDLGADLRASLKRSIDGFKLIEAERVKTAAGDAWFTSWYSGERPLVHSNLVVPAGKSSFTLDASVKAGSDETAEDVGDIFSAFQADQP